MFSAPLAAREFAVGLLSVADDERYSPRAIEKGYPEAPSGRSAVAAQLALEDAGFMLQSAGWSKGRLVAVEAPDQAGLPAALEGLLKQGVRHVVLELPASGVTRVTAAARGKDLLLVNAAAPEDVLRAAECAPNLLHTLPSHAMQSDAIAQLLVASKWNRPLVLYGPSPQDSLLLAAFARSAKKIRFEAGGTAPLQALQRPARARPWQRAPAHGRASNTTLSWSSTQPASLRVRCRIGPYCRGRWWAAAV